MTYIPSQTTLNNVNTLADSLLDEAETGVASTDPDFVYYVDLDALQNTGIFYDVGGTPTLTLTLAFSNDDDVASGSATYLPAPTTIYSASSFTADVFEQNSIPITVKWLRLTVAPSGSGTDGSFQLTVRGAY